MTRANSNGIEIEYESFGAESAPAILLICGLGTQLTRWATPLCERLVARGFRVIRFDNRDVGLSTHFTAAGVPNFAEVVGARMRGEQPHLPYVLRDMAKDAVGLLDALGIARAHIVGRSMGGMIGQLIAIEHPERVLSFVSIFSTTGNPGLPASDPEALAAMRAPAPNPFTEEAAFIAHAIRVARVNSGSRFPFDEDFIRVEAVADARRAYEPTGSARQFAALMADGDRRERLKSVTSPTLVIHGDEDRLIPIAAGRDTAEHIRGALFEAVPGLGHEIPRAMYAEIATRIADWAQGADTGKTP